MNTTPDSIEFEPEEIDAATEWHGGQSSMLYAVASTGALKLGTHRPYGDCGPMTDDEWMRYLASQLAGEASDAAELEDEDEIRQALLGIAAKAEAVSEE